ncbi:MAG: FAD-dependent oxidoreductase [Rhodospirillales bacterium]|jgi:dimethylglycine dehydrogenase
MKSHVQAVVVGGGVVGASVLYHLTKLGWRDVMLIERSELTSGSTWHAAGGMHTINGDPNVAKLQQYTINLYKEIEEISGVSCGVHITGGLMLAGTKTRFDWLKMVRARGRYLGMDLEFVDLAEAKRLFPLMDPQYFVGALYDPIEGHVDPWGVTNAYVKAATLQGATVERHNRVIDTVPRADGGWDVVTEKGTVHAEHVVNAGGLWAREVGRMVGLELPILAMEHQYIISEEIPEVAASATEMLHIVDSDGEIYMRQEGKGMLMGTYERAGVPWSERETPWSFGHELLNNDIDRIAPSLEVGFRHYPAIEKAGIKKIINGPFTFAPDGNPVIGPVRGLRNYWVACGVMAGFSQGGGVGLSLARWMIEGDPGADIWGMDVARFGDWATMAYTNAKVRENYSRRFRIRFPNEELTAARPLKTTPIYDRLKSANAVFGDYWGMEHALWFAPAGTEPAEEITFRRSNAHPHVAAEVNAARTRIGLTEISSYGKFEIEGHGAEAWLSRIMANRMPGIGRIVLSPMLNDRGRLIGDFTIARLAADRFFLVGTMAAERFYQRWFERHLPDRGVAVRACANAWTGLSIAGPGSRALLQKLVRDDLSSFPFLSFRRMDIGMAPAMVGRISFTGDLGYEIWMAPEYQRYVYDLIADAGREAGVRHFGSRALNAMRLEKGFGSWAREYRPLYSPVEAALGRFVAWDKPDFIGRSAAHDERGSGGRLRLCAFQVDAGDADAIGDEPIWHDGKPLGWVTSGGYGHFVGTSLALGYVPREVADAIDGFEIEIIGERRRAKRLAAPLFDPTGARMRG